MPYLGNTPSTSFATVVKDSFSGDGSTTAFTLSKVATTNSVSVFVENVRQEPTTAYAVSGTTLTFTAAPVTSSGNNIYVLHMNPTTTTTHPSAQNLTAVDGTFTGNIDVDGTANLDAVDIDGAVDMASTLAVGGAVTVTTGSSGASANSVVDDLVVQGSGRSGISILTPDANDGQLVFGSPSDNIGAFISYKHSNTTMELGTSIASGLVKVNAADGTLNTTFEADGDVNISNGNLVVASGHGIDFSATGGPTQGSGTSELLDDYEEGTWTPTLLGSSSHPSITTSVAAGKFVRIGSLVYIQWNMIITNVSSSGAGNAQVGGIPFAHVCNTYQGYIGIMYNDVWSNETQKGYIPNGQSYIQLAPTGRTQSNLGVGTVSTGYFGGGGSYLIA